MTKHVVHIYERKGDKWAACGETQTTYWLFPSQVGTHSMNPEAFRFCVKCKARYDKVVAEGRGRE